MKRFNKENFKTLLLTMLFILSIALNQQLWERISLAQIMPSVGQLETIEVKRNTNINYNISDILSPQSFRINFGGGLHTVLYSDTYGIWKETLKNLKDGYFEKDVLIEEIDKEKWLEANNFRSIEMRFGYNMPIDLLREMVEGKKEGIYGKVDTIDRILISLMGDRHIYIANHKEGKYYMIQSMKEENNFYKIVRTIEESRYDAYYALSDIYGVQNNELMPIDLDDNIHQIQVVREIDPTNDGQVEAFAGTFFGENLDFIRKIIETSGSVIYMYGYGQKALKIDDLGVLQYIEKIDKEEASKNIKFEEAIKIALAFISEHGSWGNIDAYLREVKPIERDNKKGYAFLFGYRLNGFSVYCSDENKRMDTPIKVEVLGNQVIYYKRFLKREKIAIKFLENKEDKVILPASQVLDKNFEVIKNDYLNNRPETLNIEEEKIAEEVLSTIQGIEIGYYDQPMNKQNYLIPIWIIKTDKITYYFNAYDGKIINYSAI
ncbi:hypothetical protein FQB35_15125 [Crassaminicella thermophila]|uniref:Regulatory protein YycH domain-containing protein n=1 Tax=Crassaminicella thermophila TaxID=2599308 RepID=A0A5C0SIH0_CRATE|nr:two-component system activity regulator YycH [Crassaminicella thermophila]QEK13487.1 hypothetical protein FQB35_15125 [Crassaminicella thermophila]